MGQDVESARSQVPWTYPWRIFLIRSFICIRKTHPQNGGYPSINGPEISWPNRCVFCLLALVSHCWVHWLCSRVHVLGSLGTVIILAAVCRAFGEPLDKVTAFPSLHWWPPSESFHLSQTKVPSAQKSEQPPKFGSLCLPQTSVPYHCAPLAESPGS